jgi:tetratricopeptide (TPR) repeat protein
MNLRCPLALATLIMFSGLACAENPDIENKINACNKAIAEGDASKALAYAEQVLKQDKNNRGALLCKGRAHGGTGQFKEALAALQAAEKTAPTPVDHIVTLILIGNVQKSAKQYPEALSTYRQSLAMAQAEKDKLFERINLNLIGETLVDSNQPEAGLESYLKGSQLAANDNERADNYARIADTYSILGKHDQAIEYQIKTVLMEERGGDLNHFAHASLELGRIYTVAKDYPNAEKSINKVIQLSKEQGGAFWEAKAYYYLALVKVANNQPQAAKTLLTDAQHICEDIGAEALSDEISQALNKLPK